MRLHTAQLLKFIGRHDLFILTTHDPADADGLGAQLVLACILKDQGKKVRIINASAIPEHFRFMDPQGMIEQWDKKEHGGLPEKAAMVLLDTADDKTTGLMQDEIRRSKEVFVIDHHEIRKGLSSTGITDPSSASTCEMTVELAKTMGAPLSDDAAFAAYIGIAYDSGFFAYPKTGPRTFQAALHLFELGIKPNDVYRHLHENATVGALLLQKQAIGSLTLHYRNQVAVQVLRLEDFASAGAQQDETEGLVNFPMRAKEVIVSVLFKESPEGKVRCSLRSKGMVNVAKIAHEFHGGGHINASGFKSDMDIEPLILLTLEKIAAILDKP
jgi:phosphoesterase RecJ-like protein